MHVGDILFECKFAGGNQINRCGKPPPTKWLQGILDKTLHMHQLIYFPPEKHLCGIY